MSVTIHARVTCRPESAMGGLFVRDRVGRVEDGRTFDGGMVYRFPARGGRGRGGAGPHAPHRGP